MVTLEPEPEGPQERDDNVAASLTAAFNVLSSIADVRTRLATYVVIDRDGRRVVTLGEFRRALGRCKRLEVARGDTDGDVYVCSL
ncbi:MAG: hypothetical protein ABR591_02505 [Candidatus Velthaea sp.]